MRDVITGKLERRLATNTGLGILGEGSKAIELLKEGQVSLSGSNGLEAAEVLVILVKAADDQLSWCCW